MAMLDSYVYHVDLEWTAGRSGVLREETLPNVEVSAPPEFHGEAGKWTPEHLLVAATSSCLMSTFLALAERSGLHVFSYNAGAFARLENVPGEGYRFTEIALVPEIGVAGEDVERALKILLKAEKNCFVSKSLRAAVQLEPKFVHEAVPVAG